MKAVLTIIVLAALVFSMISCYEGNSEDCGTGWRRIGNRCYLFSNNLKAKWISASNFCRSLGGGLAVPSTPGEHRFLKRIARHSGEGLIWIGVADFIEEGKWLTFPYTWYAKYVNWGGNEPNGGAGENCAVMSRGYDYRWADYSCSNVFKFICERAK